MLALASRCRFSASQVPRFEQFLPKVIAEMEAWMLRRYRASSSYLPLWHYRTYVKELRRYRASSSYLPELLSLGIAHMLRRYRASSSYLPVNRTNMSQEMLRRYRASSS